MILTITSIYFWKWKFQEKTFHKKTGLVKTLVTYLCHCQLKKKSISFSQQRDPSKTILHRKCLGNGEVRVQNYFLGNLKSDSKHIIKGPNNGQVLFSSNSSESSWCLLVEIIYKKNIRLFFKKILLLSTKTILLKILKSKGYRTLNGHWVIQLLIPNRCWFGPHWHQETKSEASWLLAS